MKRSDAAGFEARPDVTLASVGMRARAATFAAMTALLAASCGFSEAASQDTGSSPPPSVPKDASLPETSSGDLDGGNADDATVQLCIAGTLDCNGSALDACEVDGTKDPKHCGACGTICSIGERCNAGACTTALSTGLLAYWSFDDAAGALAAADSSPSKVPAVVSGTVTFVPGAGLQGSGAAQLGGAGSLRARFPNNALGQGTGAFIPQGNISFAMWFKTAAPGQDIQGLQVVTGDAWGVGCDRVIGNASGGVLTYNLWSEINLPGKAVVNDGKWHHVVYVIDKAVGQIAYVDGTLDATAPSVTTNCGLGCSGFNWASDYAIGTAASCRYGATDFTGLMDEVRIYNRVLSAAEVARLFSGTR